MPLAPKTFDAHDLGIQWAIPEKKNKQTGGGDWRYGFSRGSMWNFWGLIKNEEEFPLVTKKK